MKKLLCLAAVSAIVFCGCESFFKKEKPQYLVSVNEILRYPRASRIEKEISTFTGDKIWINTNPFLHSKKIKKIEIIPRKDNPETFDLQLTLDYHGKLVWMQISNQFAGKDIAFIIDGICYLTFRPERLVSEEDESAVAVIKGPFERHMAELLRDHSKANYEFFNQD